MVGALPGRAGPAARLARLAWPAWAVAMALGLGAAALVVGNGDGAGESGLLACFVPGFATVGALIAGRTGRTVGWLLLAVALVAAAGAFSAQYALRAYVTHPGALPAAWPAAWAMDWLLVLLLAAFGTLLLLYPDGRLPSPGWRPLALGLGAAFALLTLAVMAREPIDVHGVRLANRLGGAPGALGEPWSWPLLGAAGLSLLGAGLAPFWRWRRAAFAERQQLKWLALAGGIACASLALLPLGYLVPGADLAQFVALLLATSVGIPVAVGIAVRRHGLYDIDRLLNRTLVYGLLTALLGLCYALVSLLFVLLVGFPATTPSWLVAAATLLAASLAGPARRRIQAVVDRRFNRRAYDAALTVRAFSERVRAHIDLGSLTGDLVAVVDRTVEPASVSLWLRPRG